MPEYLAPGVYVEETSFRSKSIEGVSTTTTGFVGPARYGPTNGDPVLVTSLGEFAQTFGDGQPLDFGGKDKVTNYLWHGVRAFFEEGGKRLYIARVFTAQKTSDGFAKVTFTGSDATKSVLIQARFPGATGALKIRLSLGVGQNVFAQVLDKKTNALVNTFSAALADRDVVWMGRPAAPAVPVPSTPAPGSSTDPAQVAKAALEAQRVKLKPADAELLIRRAVESAEADAASAESDARAKTAALAQARGVLVAKTEQSQRFQQAWEDADRALTQALGDADQTDAAAKTVKDAAATALAKAAASKLLADAAPADTAKAATAAKDKADSDAAAIADTTAAALAVAARATAGRVKVIADDALAAKAKAAGEIQALVDAVGDDTKAAVKAEADARKLATDKRALAKVVAEVRDAAKPTIPAALTLGAGKLYLVTRDAATGAVTFDDRAGGTVQGDAVAADREVRIVQLALNVGPAQGTGPGVPFTALPLDPKHQSNGRRDSAFAVFAPDSDDATLPVSVQAVGGADLDGIDVVKTLFAKQVPGLPDNNTDTVPLPANNVFGPYGPFTLDRGNDGQLPDPGAYEGDDGNAPGTAPSGLKALETAEDISIVAAPGHTAKVYADANASYPEAITRLLISHAERMRYRIAVLDGPEKAKLPDIRKYRAKLDSTYAALYYPWVTILDPITRVNIDLPPSGFVSGIYARNDSNFAVYKAPANEPVRLALGFAETINQGRQEVLNPEGINCFRYFEGRGNLLWGARTISSDSEWKYVNLRRYFAYLERSIDRGSQFAVFMPNGERLWANVRRAIAEFLLNEWQSGALLGDRPEKAFFVKCDRTTMTQNDLDNGRLVCLVGVAPLRPAEFVIFRIGQWTGDAR